MAQFNRDRWQRVGATGEQLAALEAAFAALDPDNQEAELVRLAGVSDSDLEAGLAGLDLEPSNGEGDAEGGPGGNESEDASPSPLEPQTGRAADSVAGHDAP